MARVFQKLHLKHDLKIDNQTRVKKFSWLTVLFTYLLMVLGNIVSATGSGLACPDWPTCHGTLNPPWHARLDIAFEWGHRMLAATTGIMILTTVVGAFATLRKTSNLGPAVKRTLHSIVVLLVIQIFLGGITVLLGLSVVASTIHLLTATIVFASMIAIAIVVNQASQSPRNPGVPEKKDLQSKFWLSLVVVGVVVQFALGGLLRHSGAGLACPHFPMCLDSFWPTPLTNSTFLAFSHRWIGVALALLGFKIWRHNKLVAVLLLMQVLLGIATVWLTLTPWMRALHAALGYGIFGVTFARAFRLGGFAWFGQLKAAR